ncbi:glycosyltransferase family 4 protein [Candidatus Falkowbacteria bacterium]|nr:glycosyltransferase family 4 protein [Candidatus Falkowbacteria bacterium]
MKIAAFINSQPHQLNQTLVEFGGTLDVYATNKNLLPQFGFAKKSKKYTSISKLHGFGDWFFFTLCAPVLWLYSFWKAVVCASKGYKVVILTQLSDKLLFTLWLRIFGIRVIWVESQYYEKSFHSNIYILLYGLLSRMTTCACLSQAILNELVAKCYVKEKNCVYVGTCIDLEQTKAQSDIYETMVAADHQVKNANLFVIGYVGDIGADDGVETLIKAVESIREFIIDLSVIIVGDGMQKKNIMWLTKMLGLDDKISFVGKQQNWMRWYNYFDIFVMPTQKSSEFSFEVAYALAHATPTIVTKVAGVEEVSAFVGGYVITPGASQDLGQAILDLYNNKQQRAQFGAQGKKRAYEEYSREVVSGRWGKLLVTNY